MADRGLTGDDTDPGPARGSESGSEAGTPSPAKAGTRAEARARRRGGRNSATDDDTSGPRGRRRPKRFRKLKITALVVATVLVLISAAGWAYWEHLNGNIQSSERNSGDGDIAKPKPDAFGHTPLNILLLGSDGRDSAENCKLGGACGDGGVANADVQMLLHVSADRSNASLVSVPRDTRVAIPACTDPKTKKRYEPINDSIADSLGRGGPGCVVAAWQNLTKVHIDHFMMVDFSGVVSMADAVGGVEVCVQQNIKDEKNYVDRQGVQHSEGSHLKLEAGSHKIQGVQALQWLRTRHAFEYGGDLGRAKAQHMYLNSMVRTLKKASTLANPTKVFPLAEAATKALHVDDGLGSLNKLIDLAGELNKIPTNRITTTTMPSGEDPRNKDHLIPAPEAERMWTMLRADTPFDKNGPAPDAAPPPPPAPTLDKATVALTVRSTPTGDRAGTVSQELVKQGFSKTVKDTTATKRAATTTLTYPAAAQDAAQAVATALSLPPAALQESQQATHLTLTIGADWKSGPTFPAGGTNGKPAANTPAPPAAGDLPTTAGALNASDDKACMSVNQEKDSRGVPYYTW
ncbi:LCP family protein [Embleya sp. AB8]|uniref:LCP family protein n=1 Tax=Embleya sp. AB8 TaxID=3156304 RepID=UPI003C78E139